MSHEFSRHGVVSMNPAIPIAFSGLRFEILSVNQAVGAIEAAPFALVNDSLSTELDLRLICEHRPAWSRLPVERGALWSRGTNRVHGSVIEVSKVPNGSWPV